MPEVAISTIRNAESEALRSSRALRALTKEEDGTDVFHLPDGVYGFTYSPAQGEMPIFTKQPFHAFEVHRMKDGSVHMVVFTTPDTSARIAAKQGPVEAVLYPMPHGDATAIVSIDVDDLQPARKAISREDGNPFRTLVYPAV